MRNNKIQQDLIQIKSTARNYGNLIGLIFLPNNPFYFEDQPFYLKKLCGMTILDRNLSVLKKNGIKSIFILSNDLKNLNHTFEFNKLKFKDVIMIKTVRELKEYATQEKLINLDLDYAIILDGGVLIDNRTVSSLLSHEKIIYTKGDNIHSNYNNENQWKILTGKIKLEHFDNIFQDNINSFENFFNSLSLNKAIYHSSDEIATYQPDMRRNLPLYINLFRNKEDFKSAKKLLVKRTQKGTLDLVAWYFNRYFENLFVYLFAESKITANHITYFVNCLGYITLFLFLTQNWWIGLILMIFINIFDGVDGKLARLKNKESFVGHIEHSFDQLYEQAIYVGIGLGSYFIINQFYVIIILIVMLLADSFNRHCSMQYKEVMKITLADSSRFDQLFRRFDGRRNIYTLHILIFGILGHFEYIVFSICIHAIITSIIYSIQAIKHMKKRDSLKEF